MKRRIALIGYGEAAAFAPALAAHATPYAFDRDTDDPATATATAAAKYADYVRDDVADCDTPADALAGAQAALSLVTANQALLAAQTATASLLALGACRFDMNSVAPDTNRAAARANESATGRYVDVAVMAPVDLPPMSCRC